MLLERIFNFFTSLRLTVVCLCLALVLVFIGTLAQVDAGLYNVQNRYFRSLLIYWTPKGADWRIPVFPGGYLIGGVLLINLLAAHAKRFQFTKKKIGIFIIHAGIILLLLGQFSTDLLSNESAMHIREGASANYSQATRSFELAVIDTTDAETDKVVAIPEHRLRKRGDISHAELPFTIRVKTFYANSSLTEKAANGYQEVKTTAGFGADLWWRELPHEAEMDKRDMPSGIVELVTAQGSLGTYLISGFVARPQQLSHNGHNYQLVLRAERFYKPFSLHLIDFKFDRYAGTDKPKNFSSRVRLQRPGTGEDREVVIYMNNPLRYAGETFFQADWDKEDEKGTILQVVHNPSWLTPYFSCVLVALGLIVQFMSHLIGFAKKRRTA